jgi:nucleotide-binding universal stress UspA family protein
MTENPLIVGIDGSPEAREALRWASRLAMVRDREVVAVHALGLLETLDGQVVSADAHRAEIEDLVQREWCAAACTRDTPLRVVVLDGDPVDVLLDVARREHAAAVVVGSRGVGATPSLALGSTSLHLIQESTVPVLVIPDGEETGRHLALRRVLVAIDGTPACSPAIDLACDIAAPFEARVDLVQALEEVPVFPLGPATQVSAAGEWAALAHARRDAEVYCHQVRDHGLPVHLTVEPGDPDEVVRAVAARFDVDLVVAATHRAGHLADGLLDSVSRRIVHVAHRPTLVVPVSRPTGHHSGRRWVNLGGVPSAS